VRVLLEGAILDDRRQLMMITNQHHALEAVAVLLVHRLQQHSVLVHTDR
jgi:hypothetical protein